MSLTYLQIADEIEADIQNGSLAAGARLPPQRNFAYDRNIAASTAGRVYQELVKRGLVTGEVGRGTYVRSPTVGDRTLLTAPDAPVDMAVNYPFVTAQISLMTPALTRSLRPDVLEQTSRAGPMGREWSGKDRKLALEFLGLGADRALLFTGSGRQAIGCAIEALVPPSGLLAVEEWTYPIALKLARRLGRLVVPVTMDADGIRPDALEAAYVRAPFRHLYVQPTLHNPTTHTMPIERRHELLAICKALGVEVIEDRTYRFLSTDNLPSLADMGNGVITIDSFSKHLAPGFSVGVLSSEPAAMDKLEQTALEMGWTAQGFTKRAIFEWMRDGTLDAIAKEKRADAASRRDQVHKVFRSADIAYWAAGNHVWLRMTDDFESGTVAAALLLRGIAVTTEGPYSARSNSPQQYIRIALSHPDIRSLLASLDLIRNEIAQV